VKLPPAQRTGNNFMHAAIAIESVTKRFGKVLAVDGLDLEVPRGSLYGFIGPNGSGKSTTLRMIMHILLPDQGDIEVLGQRDTRAAHDRVSYLPEERGLYKRMSVRRLLRYFGSLKGARQPELDQSIDLWLDRMGLSEWIDKKIDALSKGMAQKIQFVATVLNQPELLILDEPFTGLDPVNAEVLKDAVLELKRKGTTVVFSTHDMSVAERLCDRIFMIYKGRKVLDGSLEEIQAIYGFDTIRLRTEGGMAALEGLQGIVEINDHGNIQEVRWRGDPQEMLTSLAERTRIFQFEITRPSLHDIFVRIASPDLAHDDEATVRNGKSFLPGGDIR
jgi:ABC-2 type transport system ATP-binding protein